MDISQKLRILLPGECKKEKHLLPKTKDEERNMLVFFVLDGGSLYLFNIYGSITAALEGWNAKGK